MTLLLSICIPTYNGETVLPETLDSILGQILDGVEVIVCDDGSSDRTLEIAQRYQASHHQVKVFQNPRNLGMDRNFTQSVQHGTGKYVWFSGQDDIFESGAIAKVLQVLNQHPDLGMIYLNYRFLSGDLSKEVSLPLLTFREDRIYKNVEDYYCEIDHAPSFLPATVMQRSFWETTHVEPYMGTHYVQVAVWLLNAVDATVYVVGDPKFISCRMPEDSWKFTGGKMLFEIFTGTFFVYKKVHDFGEKYVPSSVIARLDREYFHNFWQKVIVLKSMGLSINAAHIEKAKYVAHGSLHFYLYMLPVLRFPIILSRVIMMFYRLMSKIMQKRHDVAAP